MDKIQSFLYLHNSKMKARHSSTKTKVEIKNVKCKPKTYFPKCLLDPHNLTNCLLCIQRHDHRLVTSVALSYRRLLTGYFTNRSLHILTRFRFIFIFTIFKHTSLSKPSAEGHQRTVSIDGFADLRVCQKWMRFLLPC